MIYVFDFDGTVALATFSTEKGRIMDVENTSSEIAYRDCQKNIYKGNVGVKPVINYIKRLLDSNNAVVILTKINDTLEFEYKTDWLKQQIGRPVDFNSNFYAIGVSDVEGKFGVLDYLMKKDSVTYVDDNLEFLLKLEAYMDETNICGNINCVHISVLYNEITK